ncbi:hypothetical protein FQN54_004832 [Arachnomyces sp. PD_36]|nr:hypothetical protein FQN54_004832 [Arachnomyces sp. PD_36]
MTTDKAPETSSYSKVACIGSGLSAVALGATLKNWYDFDDVKFFERHATSGGTWYINSYPGCACDVPSALYSYSFEPNPGWTKLMPSNKEIKEYHDGVIAKYKLREKMAFSTEVVRCVWNGEASCWIMYLQDLKTGREYTHMCQILFSAAGQLAEPRPCDIPGYERFKGRIFHSARWDRSADLKGKNVVVIGNGCTATQIVPSIIKEVNHLTQIIRSKHWIFPAPNFEYPAALKWLFKWVPFTILLHRFHVFLMTENEFRLVPMTKAGARFREGRKKEVDKYMRETAPEKYHDLLIPDFEVGCKRRIFNCGYLEALHSENLTLTDSKPLEITPTGLRLSSGEFIEADVIVLATGFQTNQFLSGTEIVGQDGKSLEDHWSEYPGPEAYNCSVLSGFPNFFLLLGPNAATGHTSALIAAENSINYALRVLAPVFQGTAKSIELKPEAEKSYVQKMQDALSKTVWNAGCQSWYYLNEHGWNSMSYPWSQSHYWYRSLFPVWSDWKVNNLKLVERKQYGTTLLMVLLAGANAVLLDRQFPQARVAVESTLKEYWMKI